MLTSKNRQPGLENINLFEAVSVAAARERQRMKRQELRDIASSLRQMFRDLSNELVLDRERSLALVAEYGGMLTDLAGRINHLREGKLGYGLDVMAEKLEQGVSYLIGFFAAHQPCRSTWRMDRTEIRGNLQKVWPIVRDIEKRICQRDGQQGEVSRQKRRKAA